MEELSAGLSWYVTWHESFLMVDTYSRFATPNTTLGNCSTGSSYGTYRRKHNPFISFENIAQNATRCANIVNADELDKDIENNTVPQFVFFTPDVSCNLLFYECVK